MKSFEDMLDCTPLVLVGHDGHWLNGPAREFLRRRGLQGDELIEWLGSGPMPQTPKWRGLEFERFRLPGGDSLFTLRNGASEDGLQAKKLTRKESEVLGYLVKGLSNKEIASKMNVSPGTINTHLDNIYRKFGCSSRLAACFIAMKKGIHTVKV
ncbi:MAG: LuxR C-terminal-related transcriptional regulator [Nitrospiraceae bacterium]|nr:LuxR C-terminal-related transcriptional regulator [Nitrospiraceae bacterium]